MLVSARALVSDRIRNHWMIGSTLSNLAACCRVDLAEVASNCSGGSRMYTTTDVQLHPIWIVLSQKDSLLIDQSRSSCRVFSIVFPHDVKIHYFKRSIINFVNWGCWSATSCVAFNNTWSAAFQAHPTVNNYFWIQNIQNLGPFSFQVLPPRRKIWFVEYSDASSKGVSLSLRLSVYLRCTTVSQLASVASVNSIIIWWARMKLRPDIPISNYHDQENIVWSTIHKKSFSWGWSPSWVSTIRNSWWTPA